MKFFWGSAFIACVVLISCTRKAPEKMVITVSDGQVGVPGMQVFLNDNRVGVSDSKGNVAVDLGKNHATHITISMRPEDDKSPFVARMARVDLPLEYFPKVFSLELRVARLAADNGKVAENQRLGLSGNSSGNGAVDASAPSSNAENSDLVVPRPSDFLQQEKINETDLPSEQQPVVAAEQPKAVSTPFLPVLTQPQVQPTPAHDEDIQKFEILVTENGRALAGAQVFSARAATRAAVLLGTTGADGVVSALVPKFLHMEQVLVRHDCCKPVLRPVTGMGRFEVPLEKGLGAEMILQHDAFGVSRALPGTEIFSGALRLDVAGPIGMSVLPMESLRQGSIAMSNREALPERISVQIDKLEKAPLKPIFRFVGLNKPAQPILGLLESGAALDSERDSDGQLWRRFRREFQGRFVQAQVFRPMISSDVQKLSSSAKLSTEVMFERGWEFSIVNPELDFLAEIRFEKNPKRFETRLVDRAGNVIFRDSVELKSGVPPEKNGGQAFEKLVSALPFEATVTAVKPDYLIANMGGNQSRGLEKNQFVEVYSWSNGDKSKPRNELVGIGKISGIDANKIQVHITHKVNLAHKEQDSKNGASEGTQGVTEGMRVVRVNSEGRNPKTGERLSKVEDRAQ